MSELDLERIKAKLEQLKGNNKNNQDRVKISDYMWKPGPEQSQVRLMKYPFSQDPFIEMYSHWGVAKFPIQCLKNNFGKDCPICEFATKLWQDGNDQDKELAKKLFPRDRYFAVVVDRKHKDPTPLYWGFSKTIYSMLLGKLLDRKFGHYLNEEKGIDLLVHTEKQGNKAYPNTVVEFDREDTPLADSSKEIEVIKSKIKPLDEIFVPPTKEDVKRHLQRWAEPEDEQSFADEAESYETTKGSAKKKEEPEEDDLNLDDLDGAFDKALEEA